MASRSCAALVAAAAAALVASGCQAPVSPGYTRSAGTLALSRDDAFLYAVDTDNEILAVVDTATRQLVTQIPVGHQPERVTVGADDRIYVTNRRSRSVSVIERGAWRELAQVPVGVEPIGLATSGDGKTLYVVSSTALESSHTGTLTAIDTAALTTRWTLPVGAEPRGVTLLSDSRALVSLAKDGDVALVDLDKAQVLRPGTDLAVQANRFPSEGDMAPMPCCGPSAFHPRGMVDLTVTPDGTRAFAPVTWASEAVISTSSIVSTPDGGTIVGLPPPGGGGSYGNGGPCSVGSIAAAGLVTFDADGAPKVDSLEGCFGTPASSSAPAPDYPPTALSTALAFSGEALQGVSVSVVDPTGSWLFIVGRDTNNVLVLPARRRLTTSTMPTEARGGVQAPTVPPVVDVGAGPNGIAITKDATRAFVLNAFDHTVSELASSKQNGSSSVQEVGPRIQIASDVLAPDVVAGRKLFFSARDGRMTGAQTGISCGSCHVDGREDGNVWNFDEGPRQTPSLAGRKLAETAPYHYSGQFPSMPEFIDITARERMGGAGVSPDDAEAISAYLSSLPAADNPNATAQLSRAQAHGQQLFAQAHCDGCHGGDALTNNGFADVGTFVSSGMVLDNWVVKNKGLNVPSLLGLARTAPYLHDGSAATVMDVLTQAQTTGAHGELIGLSRGDLGDLAAYLETL